MSHAEETVTDRFPSQRANKWNTFQCHALIMNVGFYGPVCNIQSLFYICLFRQDFEVNLHGAQTLRILCYQMEDGRNTLLGKCALQVSTMSSSYITPIYYKVQANLLYNDHFDGLVQERCNASALAMELRLSCSNPSIFSTYSLKTLHSSSVRARYGVFIKSS